MEPFCQLVTRRVRMRTPACGLSMMLVVASSVATWAAHPAG
jgi:hypothetical protein